MWMCDEDREPTIVVDVVGDELVESWPYNILQGRFKEEGILKSMGGHEKRSRVERSGRKFIPR